MRVHNGRRDFLAALTGEKVDLVPVGSPTSVATLECMERAGACFPQAHLDGELMAALAATAYTVLGYDCVMPVFSVHQEAAALGCEMRWGERDTMPVELTHPWSSPEEVRLPKDFLDRPAIQAVLRALRILKREYGHQVAVIGKVMGPWTLSYHMHGLEDFLLKTILEPETVRAFLHRLGALTVMFGKAQIEAGADALCVADHATGDLVGPKAYRDLLLPVHQTMTRELGCLTILHICGNTLDRLDYICQAGFNAFHFDSKVGAGAAVEVAAGRLALIGNVNNPNTLLQGTPDEAYAEAMRALEAHVSIVGPECAVPLQTPNANLIAIAQAARDFRR